MWYLKTRSKSLTIFQTRLASTDWNGLNAPSTNAEYICQYHGSLIGKHFKSLAQVMPFLIYDIVPQDVLRAWNVIGALVVLLWHTEIEDLEGYLVRLCLSHLKSNNKVCIRHLFHERSTIFSISLPNVLRASWSRSQNFTFLSTFLPLSVNLALQLSSQLSAMSPSIMYFAYHASQIWKPILCVCLQLAEVKQNSSIQKRYPDDVSAMSLYPQCHGKTPNCLK